jgi:stage II sporulation protein R
MIGEAEGQNFWCVLFPPLCMTAATVKKEEAEEEFIAVGLTPDQYAIITETENTKYKLRFKFLEVLQGWFR